MNDGWLSCQPGCKRRLTNLQQTHLNRVGTLRHELMPIKRHMYYVKTAVSTDIFCQCHVRSGTTSARPNCSPSHWLNGLWKQGKWFPSDNRRCISLRHSSPFTIHPANGNNSIYHRGRHPQNNWEHRGRLWLIQIGSFFSGILGKKRSQPNGTSSWPFSPERSMQHCHYG